MDNQDYQSSSASVLLSDTDRELLAVPHHTFALRELPTFRPLFSILTICLEIIFIIGLLIAVHVLQYIMIGSPYPILVYAHLAAWGSFILSDRILSSCVTKIHLHGYHSFSKRIAHFSWTTTCCFSAGNAILLLVTVLYGQFFKGEISNVHFFGISLKEIHFMKLIVSLESCICIPLLSWLLFVNICFYKSKALPDLEREEVMGSFVPVQSLDFGCRDLGSLEDIVEKQTAMIQYLKDRNNDLCQRIHNLVYH